MSCSRGFRPRRWWHPVVPWGVRIWTPLALVALLLAGCSTPSNRRRPRRRDHDVSHSAHPSAAPELTAGAGERVVTVGVPVDFQPQAPAGATDEYRCFVVDPGLTEDAMITGTEFVPGNPAIVHHSILYAAYPGQVAAAEQLDAEDPGPGYECFGGSRLPSRDGDVLAGLDQSDWITAWAPGGGVNELPDGYGMALPAGGRVVIQMHYNLRSEQGTDSTQVRLRVTEKNRKPLQTMLLPAPVELPCTPQESGRLCNRTDAVDDVISRFGAGSGATVAGCRCCAAAIRTTHAPVRADV